MLWNKGCQQLPSQNTRISTITYWGKGGSCNEAGDQRVYEEDITYKEKCEDTPDAAGG
jgi:hypothetical protein